MEVYVRRVHRVDWILDLDVVEKDGKTACTFGYELHTVEESQSITSRGILSVVKSAPIAPR